MDKGGRAFWRDKGEGSESLRAGEPKPVLTGRENLNKVPLGGENLNRVMWAGRTLENQAFSQILPFKGFILKASTSGG